MINLFIGAPQILLILVALLFPVIALIDILRNEFSGNNKLIWVLVVIFFSFIGTILYFIIGRKQRINNT